MSSLTVLMDETRQSWRGLLRRPGYLLLAMLTLALGVATVSIVFSMLHQAVLRPLPFPHAEQLVVIGHETEPGNTSISPYEAELVRERVTGLETSGLLMSWTIPVNIAFAGRAEVVRSLHADQGWLTTLGLPLALGRQFNDDEQRRGGPQAVLLSHAFWRTRFAANPAVIGESLQLEGRAVPIVGVLPASLQWPDVFDIVLNFQPDPNDSDDNQKLIARLKPDASLAAIAAQVNTLLSEERLRRAGNDEETRERLQRAPPTALALESSLYTRHARSTLWLFLAAAGCVLLIAAVNLASLMGVRTLARSHDSAVRMALGASRFRLSVPALAEGLMIGLSGSFAGIVLAWLGLRAVSGMVPPEWMRGQSLHLSALVPVFALVIGIVTALLSAGFSLLRARQPQWARELISGNRSGPSRQSGRLNQALVITQIALATLLLACAALFTRSLMSLQAVPMGFESERVIVFGLSPVKERNSDAEVAMHRVQRMLERLAQIPGIVSAGASSGLPTASHVNSYVGLPNNRAVLINYSMVSPDFLQVLGIPLLTGRGLNAQDVAGAENVVVVDAAFAKEYLDGDALGQLIDLPQWDGSKISARVVGVVGDIRTYGPQEPPTPTLYVPLQQISPWMWSSLLEYGPLSFAVRLNSDASGAVERLLREAIDSVDPEQPIADVQSMQVVVAAATAVQRMQLAVVGVFSGLALLLASVGLYAVMAVAVTARQHELGVRAALGATPMRLLRLVLRESGQQIALGVLIGLVAAFALSQWLRSFVFEISAADPLALAVTLGVLSVVGLVASLFPALRASRVAPAQVLRVE